MSIRTRVLRISFMLLLAALVLPDRAVADEYYALVQITCVPELNYFAIRSFGLYNTPSDFLGQWGPPTDKPNPPVLTPEQLEAYTNEQFRVMETKFGFYTAERLKAHPYTCETKVGPHVGGTPMNIRVGGISQAPSAGYCRGNGLEEVNVTINGQNVGGLSAQFACPSPDRTFSTLEASNNGVETTVLRCDLDFAGVANTSEAPFAVKATCRNWNLK